MRRTYEELLAFLDEEISDAVSMVIVFDEDGYTFLRGEDWYDDFVDQYDTRSPEEMHRDAVEILRQTDLAGQLYGNEINSQVRVTEIGLGIYILPDTIEGAFVWIDPETDVSMPSFVRECIDRIPTEE